MAWLLAGYLLAIATSRRSSLLCQIRTTLESARKVSELSPHFLPRTTKHIALACGEVMPTRRISLGYVTTLPLAPFSVWACRTLERVSGLLFYFLLLQTKRDTR